MQPALSSKSLHSKNLSSGGSRVGKTTSQKETSRTRNNSSGGASTAGPGGRTLVYAQDGRNVTPKGLLPSLFQPPPRTAVDHTAEERHAEEDARSVSLEATLVPAPPPPEQLQKLRAAALSEEELGRNVDIVLSETDTFMLLALPSRVVGANSAQYSKVVERNRAYEALCASKADSDQYKEQHTQTRNLPHKSKEVLAAPPTTESVEVNANGWDIHDTFASEPVPRHEQIQRACARESAAALAQAVQKPGCLFTLNEPYPSGEVVAGEQTIKRAEEKKQRSGRLKAPGTVSAGASAAVYSSTGASRMLNSTADSTGQLSNLGSAVLGDTDLQTTDVVTGDEATMADEETMELLDPMPWKMGKEAPIPEELNQAVRIMERIVAQNVFHEQHMIYRDYPTLEELARQERARFGLAEETDAAPPAEAEASTDTAALGSEARAEGEEGKEREPAASEAPEAGKAAGAAGPYLQDLFCFAAPQLTNGMTVTCAEWNRHNEDLLAVSYGDTSPVPLRAGGLVLFWSLKNPTYPERVIRTRHGVTALHFSSVHPNMVAAGTHEGSVMIWDLRRPSDTPVLRSGSSVSTHNDQKHTDIVWETRWVDQGSDKQEFLVSVSSDGNVLQWSMKKGLEQNLLMQLRRLQNPHLGANSVYGHKEGVVSRKSSGFCVDFPRHDPSIYLVGTEDGLVHRCSTSYNEQYLDTYYGHSGPVYKVRCSPFMSHAFLTCSADWTMKLWTTKALQGHQPDSPLLTFQSTDLYDAVNDVIWSPQISTSFAAAMDDGRVELWDLSEKPLDPLVVHYPQSDAPQRRRTCVRFSPNWPVIIAGDDRGSVDVMRMHNTNQSYYSDQEQQDRLNAVMVKKR